ncbi:hypothetical protein DFH06DRAFT_1340066 [Mycena polygramma]|nr:hypothetical protein DFH06DRAFT_1340066 [Mycena polygramma]
MNTLLSSVLLALFASAAIAVPVNERDDGPPFSVTCSGISFNPDNNSITADCLHIGTGSTTSTIGLNSCVGNENGAFLAHCGPLCTNFSTSCSSISVIGTILSGICTTTTGTQFPSIDLNSVLSNENGILTC